MATKSEIKEIVNSLVNKTDNEDALAYIDQQGIPDEECIKASEVAALAQEVIDQRGGVKTVHFNGVDYTPDSEGKVTFAYSSGGATYESALKIQQSLTPSYVVAEKKFIIGVRYSSVVTSNTGQANAGITGTLLIRRGTSPTNFTQVGTRSLTSYDYDSAYSGNEYQEIDLSEYLDADTKYYFQLIAQFPYTDPSSLQTVYAQSPAQIFSGGIIYTNLSLTYKGGWSTIQTGDSFPLDYYLTGRVEKKLHIVVDNEITLPVKTYSSSEEYPTTSSGLSLTDFTKSTYPAYFTDNKVHQIESWLSCDDGLGGTLESTHLINQILYAKDTTDDTQYLVVQNIQSPVTNYVQVNPFLEYAVLVPSLMNNENPGTVNVDFKLTDYNKLTTYASLADTPTINQANTLPATIEIESSDDAVVITSYTTFLRIYVNDVSKLTYYDTTSASGTTDYFNVSVDNSSNYAPTPNADFYLNPKSRNNDEDNPDTIINSKTNTALSDSLLSGFNTTATKIFDGFSFINDGWITNSSDNQRVLRVLAGQTLVIPYDAFSVFRSTPGGSTTIEFDIATRNMTYQGEKQPILSIGSYTSANTLRGLEMKPIDGLFYKRSEQNDHDFDFHWQEDTRTHIMINIRGSVTAMTGATSMPLVKIFINGIICREFKFTAQENEFYDNGKINPIIIGGNDGCDIDIYSIRCYKRNLGDTECMQNYKSSLPTSAEKVAFKENNDITTGGQILYSAAREKYNCMVWYGDQPSAQNKGDKKGYLHIDITDEPEFSGDICASNKTLPCKGQGSTAKTYYWWNHQYDCDKASGTIEVEFNNLHSDFGWTATDSNYTVSEADATDETSAIDRATYPMYLDGTQIQGSAYEDLPEANKALVTIVVPDGWIDGNGKYRGQKYTNGTNIPYATKLVIKINYASSMQSHKEGCTELYNDLYRRIVTTAPVTATNARVSVYERPFLFFVQSSTDSQPVFQGLGTFGAGKCDKNTWGFNKKKHAMLEGSKNNEPLTDMLVPFDKFVTYNEDEEYFEYAGQGNLDDDWKNVEAQGFRPRIEEIWNFLYEHNPKIAYYNGTKNQFDTGYMPDGVTKLDTATKYWFTAQAGTEYQFRMMRYHWTDRSSEDATGQWVNAGYWDKENNQYAVLNLAQSSNADIVAAVAISNPETANQKLIEAIVADAKLNIGNYVNVEALQFHYAFINMFCAGSDNCSKNTYYFYNKDTNKIELHQDDTDTIFLTDNNGWQIKKYFTDRYHDQSDVDDGYTSETYYEGKNNVLFNLCELMWEDSLELRQMMWQIMYQMCQLVSAYNTAHGTNYDVSPWGCINRYFFSIQEYFPAVAYNETARVRYEYPESTGYNASQNGGRNVAPITQSLGNQLEGEKEYMRRRLVLYASYCSFGEFGQRNTTYVGNVFNQNEKINSFGFTASARPGGFPATFGLNVKPSQVLYLNYTNDTQQYHTHTRMVPFTGTAYSVTIGSSASTSTSGNAMALYGADYFSSYGNLGNLSVSSGSTFTISGKRLEELEIIPSDCDNVNGTDIPLFRAQNLVVSSPLINKFDCSGCTTVKGQLNLSNCIRLQSINTKNTNLEAITLPSTTTLKTIALNDTLTEVSAYQLESVSSLSLQSWQYLTKINVEEVSQTFHEYMLYIMQRLNDGYIYPTSI